MGSSMSSVDLTGAFETLQAQGLVSCAVCGSSNVEKGLMAPAVSKSDHAAKPPARPLSDNKTPAEKALSALRAHVEKNLDYVGTNQDQLQQINALINDMSRQYASARSMSLA